MEKNGVILDNRWVVFYNLFFLFKYIVYINVEICISVFVVKYFYKYIYKLLNYLVIYLIDWYNIINK